MVNIIIRNATYKDLDSIMKVEEEAWPPESRASRNKFEERLNLFPDGFFVALLDNKIVGVTTSQIIDYNPENPPSSWREATADGNISKTHNPDGNAIYVVSLGVSPKGRPQGKSLGIGTTLLEKLKKLVQDLKLQYLVLCSRVPEYEEYCRKNGEIGIEVYLSLQREDKQTLDKEIRFYERLGLRQVKICPNSMEDLESRNYGVMMEWKVN